MPGDGTKRYLEEDYPVVKHIAVDANTMIISVELLSNCCNNFLVEAEVVDGHSLNLIYHEYGGLCSCTCKYILDYVVEKSSALQETKLEYILLNSDMTRQSKISLLE